MKRAVKIIILLCFLIGILGGCNRHHTQSTYRAVTQVNIVTQYHGQLLHRHYNTPDKMRPVLLYLRLLKPQGKPVSMDAPPTDVYLISVHLSDGQRHYYRQAAHRYFSKENGPWKTIDPDQAAHLYSIMRDLPSDL